jgi:acetylornithine/succinyldiaminopimelate/putrescine aminotransferase
VGEASQVLVLGSTFEGNRLALAVKDLSVAHVSGNTFKENATVFGVYRKKAIHGGAVLMLYSNEFVDNTKERDVDALSRIEQKDAPDAKVWAQFGVNE